MEMIFRPSLAAAVLFVSIGCRSVPVPVEDLQAEQLGGKVLVRWRNPVDFDRVSIEAIPAGGTSGGGLEPAGPAPEGRTGSAAATLSVREPGTYTIRAVSTAAGVSRTAEKVLLVERPIDGALDRSDLGRAGDPEPVDVVFIIHPGCRAALASTVLPMGGSGENGGSGAGGAGAVATPGFDPVRLFRQTAANALAETFRSAVEIEDEGELSGIEKARDLIVRSRMESDGPILRLLDPSACVVVDFRSGPEVAGGPISHQVGLQLLDLRLDREAGKLDDEGLRYNRRPLVVEGYQEVGPFADRSEMFLHLRDAWRDLLAETVGSPRYGRYKELLAAGAGQEEVRALFLADLPESWRPLPAKADEFEARIRRIETEILFDPDPPGTTGAPGPGPAAPAPVEPAPAGPERPPGTDHPPVHPGDPAGQERLADPPIETIPATSPAADAARDGRGG